MDTLSSIISYLLLFHSVHGFIVQEPNQNASIHAMYTQLKQEIATLSTEFMNLENNLGSLTDENINLKTSLDNLTNNFESFKTELTNINTDNSQQQNHLQNMTEQTSSSQTALARLTSATQQTEQQFSTLRHQLSLLNEQVENQTTELSYGNSHTNQSVPTATNNTIDGKTRIGFSVSMPEKATIGRDGPLKFTNPIYNDDDAFNFTTAKFHCKTPGLYFFSSTIIRETGGYPESFCYLMINDFAKAYLGAYSFKASYGNPSGTATILYHMQEGDTAYVGMCGVIMQISQYSNFNGYLINKD